MNEIELLALAGLVHDLPKLFAAYSLEPGPGVNQILQLADLQDPELKSILTQAEGFLLPDESSRAKIVTQNLISIFTLIQLESEQLPDSQYIAPQPLAPTNQDQKYLFPQDKLESSTTANHIEKFAKQLDQLGSQVTSSSFDVIYSHLSSLLHQHLWCIPAHTPDVSFYDHARLTSAIAVSLFLYKQGNPSPQDDAYQFSLLVGDLSGIQDYIFDIASIGAGGVARRLRARSFFISLLTDIISHQAAFHFNLPLGNIIISSGGKFYLLAPNLPDLESRLSDFRTQVDSYFRQEFNAELALNMAAITFPAEYFHASSQSTSGFGDVLRSLGQRLNRQKRYRAGNTLTSSNGGWDQDAFVIPRDFWSAGDCLSCHKFPQLEGEPVCDQCYRDYHTGQILPSVRYIAYYNELQEGEHIIPLLRGCCVKLITPNDLSNVGTPYLISKLNDPNLAELHTFPANFRYLTNHIPVDKYHHPLTFEEIAKKNIEKPTGRVLLGYIKADVDFLGMIFSLGLRRDQGGYDTASHIIALSRALDGFFSAWLQHLLSSVSNYQLFYTIFSGGDDLFLVGPWDEAAELIRKLQGEFTRYVSANPEITLSAGILFTKESYPIWRASQDAEQVLEKSKDRTWIDSTGAKRNRNQLTIFNDTFTWDQATPIFDQVEELKRQLKDIKSAFLYNLIAYSKLYRMWKIDKKIQGLRYKPLFAYNIARNLRTQNQFLYDWSDTLLQSLNSDSPNLVMDHLGLIATYLLFYKRERN